MNKIVEKAKELNQFDYIPELEIGEVVELRDVWDGDGEVPEDSYSYLLTYDGYDGNSNIEVCINYEFEIIEKKEHDQDSLIRITNIELV